VAYALGAELEDGVPDGFRSDFFARVSDRVEAGLAAAAKTSLYAIQGLPISCPPRPMPSMRSVGRRER